MNTSMSPPNSQKVAVTWIDLLSVLLIAVMGMGLWHLCESQVRDALRGEEPDEGEIQERFQVSRFQRELTQAEEAWKTVSKELVTQRLEKIRLTATLDTLDKTTEGYSNALVQHAISSRVVDQLGPYVRGLEIEVGRKEAVLFHSKSGAADEWADAQHEFEQHRRHITLAWAAGLAAILLVVLWTPLSWEGTLQPLGSFHPTRVLAMSTVLLIALFAYQAFGASGLSLASAALLLILLVALLHRHSS